MSRMASALVSRVMIMPGGITSPPTCLALSVRLAYETDHSTAATRANSVRRVTAASCGPVTAKAGLVSACIIPVPAWPAAPCAVSCPSVAWPSAGGRAV
jgi:hypothetical protein